MNVHVNLIPRTEFRKIVEGSFDNSFVRALLAKGRLLYTHDETIADLCTQLQKIGAHDTRLQLLRAATHALPSIYKAHKWFITRGDLEYTALWILYAATGLAQIEVVSRRLLADREVILQALKLNPDFFKKIYTDLLNAKKTRKAVQDALDAVDAYMAERAPALFSLVIEHLRERGAVVEGHRRSLLPPLQRQRCRYRVRVPGGSADDWQGVPASPTHEEEFYRGAGARVLLCERSNPPMTSSPRHTNKRMATQKKAEAAARTTIAVQGARVHNLKNISVEIPRDRLTVVTGLSGSGKSSLAFDDLRGRAAALHDAVSFAKRFMRRSRSPTSITCSACRL